MLHINQMIYMYLYFHCLNRFISHSISQYVMLSMRFVSYSNALSISFSFGEKKTWFSLIERNTIVNGNISIVNRLICFTNKRMLSCEWYDMFNVMYIWNVIKTQYFPMIDLLNNTVHSKSGRKFYSMILTVWLFEIIISINVWYAG